MLDQTLPIVVCLWAVAYLIGATPVSYLLGRYVGGVDLRRRGSGNVGGSNLASQLGRRWMPVIIAVDFARGAGPATVGWWLVGLGDWPWLLAITPLFTLAGNAWSPFLRFAGGRSVGVWAGGILGFSPTLMLVAVAAYLLTWMVSRRSPESLLVIMALLPPVCLAWPDGLMVGISPSQLAAYAAIGSALILAKRVASNGGPWPAGCSRGSVLLNRLFRDRDIADRQQWLSRVSDRAPEF